MLQNRLSYYALSFTALLAIAGCASTPKAPLPADADASAEIGKASAGIEQASAKGYDVLAPNKFEKAVDYRNSASEKLSRGKDRAKVLADAAAAQAAIREVEAIGEANRANLQGVLEARRYAMAAQAPKFEEKKFKSAEEDLKDIGEDIEKGKYSFDAKDVAEIEREYGEAEIAARKHGEIGNAKLMIEQAEDDGAKSRTPALHEIALSRLASAEHAIELSPHSGEGYATAVEAANQSALKLKQVLAIARQNNTEENAALMIWNQNQQLAASQAALSSTQAAAQQKLQQTKAESEAALEKTREEAAAEQRKLESDLAEKQASLISQGSAISALKEQNQEYASSEELKQKIEEVRKTFSPDEAEVMKDGTKIVVRLKKMQFSSGRAELNPDAMATLSKVDKLIASVPAKQVTVEGHTDSLGSNSVNKALSEKRAESVKKYLVSQGLAEELKVDTQGYGSDRPLTTNKTKEGRATNRRVDIVIDTPVVL